MLRAGLLRGNSKLRYHKEEDVPEQSKSNDALGRGSNSSGSAYSSEGSNDSDYSEGKDEVKAIATSEFVLDDVMAQRGLAKLRERLRKSPNDISALFAPHLAYTCTFIPNPPRPAIQFKHAYDWNADVRLKVTRNAPSMQYGKSRIHRLSRREQMRRNNRGTLLDPAAVMEEPNQQNMKVDDEAINNSLNDTYSLDAKNSSKKRDVTRGTKREKSDVSAAPTTKMPNSMETLASMHEQEISRLILLREHLLVQAAYSETVDRKSVLSDLARVSLLVVETILKFNRAKHNREADEPTDFSWKGSNYLLKMASDTGGLEAKNSDQSGLKLSRNPMLLAWNLDCLREKLQTSVLSFPLNEVWRILHNPTSYEIRQHTAALLILREEAHFQRQEKPRTLEMLFPQKPDPLQIHADCLQEISEQELSTKGCWQRDLLSIHQAAPQIASPVARTNAKKLFHERLNTLEKNFEENCETEVQRRDNAAKCLQRFSWKIIRKARICHIETCSKSAIQIQRHWRGRLARAKCMDLKTINVDTSNILPVIMDLERQENSAINIQCLWRRVKAKYEVQLAREDNAITVLSSWYRCRYRRRWFVRYLGARSMQKVVRGKLARCELQRRRVVKQKNIAATAIQKQARIMIAKRIKEDLRRDRAARCIQLRARVFVCKSLKYKAEFVLKLQMAWRQHHARCVVQKRRILMQSICCVQRWFREIKLRRVINLEMKLAAWRQRHLSKRAQKPGTQNGYMCGLLDHERELRSYLKILQRTATARVALDKLQQRIRAHTSRTKHLKIAFVQLRAMRRIRDQYEQMLELTRHLTQEELACQINLTLEKLKELGEAVSFTEGIARVALKARQDFETATRVTDMQDYVLCRAPTEVQAFNRAYAAAKRREKTLGTMEQKAKQAEQHWRRILVECDWSHQVRVRNLQESDRLTRHNVRTRNAKHAANQIGQHVRTRAIACAAERRAEVKRSALIAEQLRSRINAMGREDAYSQAHRGYLAASPQAMHAARKKFDAFDRPKSRHPGEITSNDFQRLAFDLGVVVPMSRIRDFVDKVDLNGNKLIDWEEFALWYFCCSKRDKAHFTLQRVNTKAGAVQLLQTGGLTTALRVNQASRRAAGFVRKATSKKLNIAND